MVLWEHFELFTEDLRVACAADKLEESELQFWERLDLANKWFKKNLPGRLP